MGTIRRFRVTVNGQVFEVTVEEMDSPGAPLPEVRSAPAPPHAAAADGRHAVVAPLPGVVLDVKVAAGQWVAAGDVLVVLEAMKMENEILAPAGGTVSQVNVQRGETVDAGDVLVVIDGR